MELWNSRKLPAPPTFTYEAECNEIDIKQLRNILQYGINFFKDQHLMKLETALLSRITYRMKTKFRNSKDFQSLEKVKKDLFIYSEIDIENKLQHLLSAVPVNYSIDGVFLPTKNMIDFILVRLQGIGKILCRVIEMCKLTMEYYECRLSLGHFWRMALIAVALISRINILSLNIIKFTCLLYIRLLPYSNKLKNSGIDWLPKDYVFPRDLKEWLNIEWSKFDEIIEIPENDNEIPLFDLVDDSDDEVEFCNEYINVDEDDDDIEIVNEFKKLNKKINCDDNLTILRGFATDHLDSGEVLSSEESEDGNDSQNKVITEAVVSKENVSTFNKNLPHEEMDVGEIITSDDDEVEIPKKFDKVGETSSFSNKTDYLTHQKQSKIDTEEKLSEVKEKSSDDDFESTKDNNNTVINSVNALNTKKKYLEKNDVITEKSEKIIPKNEFFISVNKNNNNNNINSKTFENKINDSIQDILISSSDDDVEFCAESEKEKSKILPLTFDFIPLETTNVKDNKGNDNKHFKKRNKRKSRALFDENSPKKRRKLSCEIENSCPNTSIEKEHEGQNKLSLIDEFQQKTTSNICKFEKLSPNKNLKKKNNVMNRKSPNELYQMPNVKNLKIDRNSSEIKKKKRRSKNKKKRNSFLITQTSPEEIIETPIVSKNKLKRQTTEDDIMKTKKTPKITTTKKNKKKKVENIGTLQLTSSPEQKIKKILKKGKKSVNRGLFDFSISSDTSHEWKNFESIEKNNENSAQLFKKTRKTRNNITPSPSPLKKKKIKQFIVDQLNTKPTPASSSDGSGVQMGKINKKLHQKKGKLKQNKSPSKKKS